MIKKSLALFVLLSASSLLAQERPPVAIQLNTLYVGADGKFESAPDTAVVQFNISAQQETAKAAYERASRNAEQIRQLLRSNGIDPKSAEIGYFSLDPVFDYKNPKRKILAYRVNSTVQLKLNDFSKVAPIVQQLSDLDVSENQTINYTLENIDAAKAKAVEDAYRRARGNAEALARAGNRVLGNLSYASADTFEPVPIVRGRVMQTMMMGTTAEAAPPTAEFTPQRITVTAHVNALFELK